MPKLLLALLLVVVINPVSFADWTNPYAEQYAKEREYDYPSQRAEKPSFNTEKYQRNMDRMYQDLKRQEHKPSNNRWGGDLSDPSIWD